MKKVLIVFWGWWWKRGTPEWWDSWVHTTKIYLAKEGDELCES